MNHTPVSTKKRQEQRRRTNKHHQNYGQKASIAYSHHWIFQFQGCFIMLETSSKHICNRDPRKNMQVRTLYLEMTLHTLQCLSESFDASAKCVYVWALIVELWWHEVVSLLVPTTSVRKTDSCFHYPKEWWTKPVLMGGFRDCVHNLHLRFGDTRFWLDSNVFPLSGMHTQRSLNLHWIKFKWELLKSGEI